MLPLSDREPCVVLARSLSAATGLSGVGFLRLAHDACPLPRGERGALWASLRVDQARAYVGWLPVIISTRGIRVWIAVDIPGEEVCS